MCGNLSLFMGFRDLCCPFSSSYQSLLQTMADPQAIAKQFTDFYYNTFDADRSQLVSLYVSLYQRQLSSSLITSIVVEADFDVDL
jgi:hypothetical protein